VGLWMTAGHHGLGVGLAAVIGALAATSVPHLSVMPLKKAMKTAEWDLLIFMAATLALGEALLSTNADEWAARRVVMFLGDSGAGQAVLVVAALALLALASHLVITSRSARAAVLIPALALPLSGIGLEPAALVMLVVLATGFCQTLSASAKPVALFAQLEQPTYKPQDLTRLSLALAPMMFGALLLFAFVIWPMLGLTLWR
jgi:solute carrier family 13 (sodium-dependent dicarboxylate transporter), member 2/3/5